MQWQGELPVVLLRKGAVRHVAEEFELSLDWRPALGRSHGQKILEHGDQPSCGLDGRDGVLPQFVQGYVEVPLPSELGDHEPQVAVRVVVAA